MEEFLSFKHYAHNAKSRMLRTNCLPSFVGKVPYNRYEMLMKIVADNELLCKICYVIENGNDINPLAYIINRDYFNSLSQEGQQRYIFRLAAIYKHVKTIFTEMSDEEIKSEVG